MSTYFIYFDNPQNPEGVQLFLDKYKAKPFEIGYIIESEEYNWNLFRELRHNVSKSGFTYMTDSLSSEMEISYPPSARFRYLRRGTDLDTSAAKFLEHYSQDE